MHKLSVLAGHCDAVGRDINEIEISNELRDKSVEDADSMREQGITLFTLGITGPEYDLTAAKQWLAWRDAQNG